MAWLDRALGLFGRRRRSRNIAQARPTRGPMCHVVIFDGTMSSLAPGYETNAGQFFRLLEDEVGADLSVYYEPGLQWQDMASGMDVLTGRGINRQIRRAYGVLAGRYRPGDKIFLVGYSRGAYAARSLGGVIERVGLVTRDFATVRHVRQAYRLYECKAEPETIREFAETRCHPSVTIEAIAVWDTVKALGIRLPVLWHWTQRKHSFHNHRLGRHVANGFQALAKDETRKAYAPILWQTRPGWSGRLEQVWFRGTHGDVGGQLTGSLATRPLSNIPFVWLVSRLVACGLPLHEGWEEDFPQDVMAPSKGRWRGMSKFFLSRRRRKVGEDPSESVHPSVAEWEKRMAQNQDGPSSLGRAEQERERDAKKAGA